MLLDAASKAKPAGVLIDTGTGKRIPIARKADLDTGEWEAYMPAPNGHDIQCDENGKPIVVRGRAKGQLRLVPLEGAAQFGWKPPAKVNLRENNGKPILATADAKAAGQESYQRCFMKVWNWRGESRRVVADRWAEYLRTNTFLDSFVIRRTS